MCATISGDPARHSFEDLAKAFYCAARVVKPGGSIILLTDAGPHLGRAADLMRQNEDPVEVLRILLLEKPPDLVGGFLWCSAAEKAKLYLHSRLPGQTAEEMFVTPLEKPEETQKLIDGAASCLVLPDAHKTLAVLDV